MRTLLDLKELASRSRVCLVVRDEHRKRLANLVTILARDTKLSENIQLQIIGADTVIGRIVTIEDGIQRLLDCGEHRSIGSRTAKLRVESSSSLRHEDFTSLLALVEVNLDEKGLDNLGRRSHDGFSFFT